MADKYDEAIAELEGARDFDRAVVSAWFDAGDKQQAGLLFQFCNKDNERVGEEGCLTLVRNGTFPAQTEELTEAIRADTRLPTSVHGVTREHLPVFAEWQRKMDALFNRDVWPAGKGPAAAAVGGGDQ